MTEQNSRSICIAAGSGDDTKLRELLDKSDKSNPAIFGYVNEDGNSALHVAAINGQEAAINLLIQAGCDVDMRNEDGKSAVWLAHKHGHSRLVNAFVLAGADAGDVDMSTVELNDNERELHAAGNDINWADEEEISNEIQTLLNKLEGEDSIAAKIKETYRKKLDVATHKLSSLFEQQKILAMSDDVDESLESLLMADASLSLQENGANGQPGGQNNVVQVMLQKRAIGLKKQLEVSDQKARNTTLQWISDKIRFKDQIDAYKADNSTLNNKVAVLEKLVRQNEQMNRDKYMMKGGDDEEEMSELDKIKIMLYKSDQELTEKTKSLQETSAELNSLKVESRGYEEKIEVLSGRVEELLRHGDSLGDQVDMMEKIRKEDIKHIAALESELEMVHSLLEKNKERIGDLERFLREMKAENEATQHKLKNTIVELQGIVETLVEEKETLVRESKNTINALRREVDTLKTERDILSNDKEKLMHTMFDVAAVTADMSKELMAFRHAVDKKLMDQRDKSDEIMDKLGIVTAELSNTLAAAQEQIRESEEKLIRFQEESAAVVEGLETTIRAANSKIKGLQFQVDNQQELIKAAVAAAVEEETAKRDVIVAQLEDANNHIDRLKEQIRTLKETAVELENNVQSAREAKAHVEAELARQVEVNNEHVYAMMEANSIRIALNKELALANDKIHELDLQLTATNKTLNETQNELTNSLLKVNELTTQLTLANKSIGESRTRKSSVAVRTSSVVLNVDLSTALSTATAAASEPVKLLSDADSAFDIGMPDFTVQQSEETAEEIEVDHPIQLFIPPQRVEELVRQSVITDNYYFSKAQNTFTNDFPIDEAFMQDLIRAFISLSQATCGLVEKTSVNRENMFELVGELTVDVENLLLKSAKDLVINLEKAKEDAITAYKIESMRQEITGNAPGSRGGGEGSQQVASPAVNVTSQPTTPAASVAMTTEQQQIPPTQQPQQTQPVQPQPTETEINTQLNSSSATPKTPNPSLSLQTPTPTVYPISSGGSTNQSLQNNNDELLINLNKDLTFQVAEYENDLNRIKLQLADLMTRNSALEKQLQESEEQRILAATRQPAAEVNNGGLQTVQPIESQVEKSTFEKVVKKVIDAQTLQRLEETKEDSEKAACTAAEMAKITKDIDVKPIILEEKIDEDALKAAILSGEIFTLGDVKTENFERLKNKGFGPDDLIALTVIEHHIQYDSTGAAGGNNRMYKMQIRSLEIQRDLIQNQVLAGVSRLDLMRYKHSCEKYLLLIDSMSVWRALTFYRKGGVFKDVLLLHLEVVNRCIDASGGWQAALKSINEVSDYTLSTSDFPEFFRVRALEVLRLKLLKEIEIKKARIESFGKVLSQNNTDKILDKKGNMAESFEKRAPLAKQDSSANIMNESAEFAAWKAKTLAIAKAATLQPQQHVPLVRQQSKNGLARTNTQKGGLLKGASVRGLGRTSSAALQSFAGAALLALAEGDSSYEDKTAMPTVSEVETTAVVEAPPVKAPSVTRNSILRRSHTFGAGGFSKLLPSVQETGDLATEDSATLQRSGTYATIDGLTEDLRDSMPLTDKQPVGKLHRTNSSVSAKNIGDTFFARQQHNKRLTLDQVDQFNEASAGLLSRRSVSINTPKSTKSSGSDNSQEPVPRATKVWKQAGTPKPNPLVKQFTNFEDRYVDILKSLHLNVDNVVLAALYDEEDANDLLTGLSEAIEHWHDSEHQSAMNTFEGCKHMNTGSNIVHDLIYLLESTNKDVPIEVNEVYEKMVYIIDYIQKRDEERDEIERLKTLQPDEDGLDENNRRLTVQHMTSEADLTVTPSPTKQDSAFFPDSPINKQDASRPHSRPHSPHTHDSRPTMYDCATQTVNVEVQSLTRAQTPATPSLTRANTATNLLLPSDKLIRPSVLPTSIICAHFQEGEFEITNGMYLASMNRLDAFLLKRNKCISDYNIPLTVRYCVKDSNTQLDSRLRLAPGFINIPVLEDCVAVLFPPVYELAQGVHLLTHEHPCSEVNVDLPRDVIVLQVLDNAELPRGLTMVELSQNIKVSPDAVAQLPVGHQLVQVTQGHEISLPVGTEVSRGVRVSAIPPDMDLPANICIVRRLGQAQLPDFMRPLVVSTEAVDEALFTHLRFNEACCIVRKPRNIHFRLGVEILRRPQGLPLPPGMKLVPLNEYPEGLQLDENLELVQLTPRFDFPRSCKISPTWYVLPRPPGMRIPPGVLVVYPDPLQLPAKPLPFFACPVAMPDIPYGTKMPPLCQAVQMMHGSSAYALPEGAELAPGLTVVNLDRFLDARSEHIARPPTPNVLLVKRLRHQPLPELVERGNREDLPPGTLLSEHLEILRVAVRFELPPGVKLDPGATLGPFTQLAPGNILSRYLEVLEWPYGVSLNEGTELVRLPSGYNLPSEYQLVVATSSVPLPTNSHIVKLPRKVTVQVPREMAAKITVGIESMVADKSLPLPSGVVFASRESKKSLWPAEMTTVPRAALHPRVLQALDKINSESSIGGGRASAVKASAAAQLGQGMNIECVQLMPYYSLPPGCCIVAGVTVLQKPYWLHTPQWVELVSYPPEDPDISLGKGVTRISLRPEYLSVEKSYSAESDDIFDSSTEMQLPPHSMLIQLSEAFQPFSWGSYVPGVEAVHIQKGGNKVFLPPGHYLVERPLKKKGEELPPGVKMGIANEYKHLLLPILAPNVEVMHIVPSFHLPPGVCVINSSVICKNSFNTSPLTNSGRFDLNWIPQLCGGDYIASGCSVIKHPACSVAMNAALHADPYMLREPHVFVKLDNYHSFQLPPNFSYHIKTNEIVANVYGFDYVNTIKLVRIANGLPMPRDRFKKDYGTAKYIESQSMQIQDTMGETNPNIVNNHIEVFRVLSKLSRDRPTAEQLVNQLVTRLSVFQLLDKKNKADYKHARKSPLFNLVDEGLLRLREATEKLDNGNAWLKRQVETLMVEKNGLIQANNDLTEQNHAYHQQHLYDLDLKAIVQKLNEKLVDKTVELNDYLSRKKEINDRKQNQIDVLTTQIAEWKHKGDANYPEPGQDREHLSEEQAGLSDELVVSLQHSDSLQPPTPKSHKPSPMHATSGTLTKTKSSDSLSEQPQLFVHHMDSRNRHIYEEHAKQLKEVQLKASLELHRLSQTYSNSLQTLVTKFENMMNEKAFVPQNTAYKLLSETAATFNDSESNFNMEAPPYVHSPVGFEDSSLGESVSHNPSEYRVSRYQDSSPPRPIISADDDSVHLDEDEVSLLTDGADRILAAALAGRIKPKDMGRKPQSMTLSSFQKMAATAEDEQFVSFTQAKSIVKNPHINSKFAQQPSRDMQTSKSVDMLMSKIKKPTEAMQQLAKLPRLHHKTVVSPPPKIPLTQTLGNSFQPINALHQSDMFRGANHSTIATEDHSVKLNELKKQITAAVVIMNATTNKKFEQTLSAENNRVGQTTTNTNATLTDTITVSAMSAAVTEPTVTTDSIATVVDESLLTDLSTQLGIVSAKVMDLFRYLHDVERTKYVTALENCELEIKYLMHSLKVSHNKADLLQCFLSEAKNRNNDYGLISTEQLRETIRSLENKLEQLTTAQIQPAVEGLAEQIAVISEQMQIEKALRFTALQLKQRAAAEEAMLREKHADVLTKTEQEISEMAQEKKASKHFSATLRSKSKFFKERAETVKEEIDVTVSRIVDLVQCYERAVQAVIPTKLQTKLLKMGTRYFEEISHPSDVLNNKPFRGPDPPLLQPITESVHHLGSQLDDVSVDMNSFAGNASLYSASRSVASKLSAGGNSTVSQMNHSFAQQRLDDASRSLNSSKVKLGGTGSMPLVTNHSHLTHRAPLSSISTGHNNRPALK